MYVLSIMNICLYGNIIRVTKSRRMRWVENVAHMRETRRQYRVLV